MREWWQLEEFLNFSFGNHFELQKNCNSPELLPLNKKNKPTKNKQKI
jgi:hypothetical protein